MTQNKGERIVIQVKSSIIPLEAKPNEEFSTTLKVHETHLVSTVMGTLLWCRPAKKAIVWIVFPRPISSPMMPPTFWQCSSHNHRTPTRWYLQSPAKMNAKISLILWAVAVQIPTLLPQSKCAVIHVHNQLIISLYRLNITNLKAQQRNQMPQDPWY